MNLLTRLERPLGWMAIGNLPIYIVTAQAILYVWVMLNPEADHLLLLDPWLVRDGHEYWRVLTFLFMVPFQNPLFAFLYLYFQYICGVALEEEWGSFPFTLYYLVGVIGAIAAAFFVGGDLRSAFYLNDAVFLAFAALFPNFQILLIVLPMKVKWLAWFTWVRILLGFYWSPAIWKVAILVSLSNYFLFFSKVHYEQIRDRVARFRHRQRYKDTIN